ncbi:MAG: 4-hydroxy-tetrahydrodipicolinate reductase [Phycisphaerales bacterium]|nr:4-hydroxy-tetrahydrodipicolinate reductase [Phycisphaerales bacterium]
MSSETNNPTNSQVRLAISGANGRMGRRLIALASEDPGLQVVSALEHSKSPSIGKDAGELAGIGANGVIVANEPLADFDVLVDFSLPAGTMHWLGHCLEARRSMVTGTTGLSPDQRSAVDKAAGEIAIVSAPNMSVGVNVMLRVAKMLGATLDASYDIEITEAHHRFKVDAPSGTAIALRDAVAEGRTVHDGPAASIVYGRKGETGARAPGEIGMHSLRLGGVVGEHTVAFATLGETLTLGHTAYSRDTFATGALHAAKWLSGRPAGMYSMQDVLFSD